MAEEQRINREGDDWVRKELVRKKKAGSMQGVLPQGGSTQRARSWPNSQKQAKLLET